MADADAPERPGLCWRARKPTTQVPFAKLLPVMRMALAAAPERLDLKRDLAIALFESDRMAEIVERLGPCAESPDADPTILFYVGRAALGSGKYQMAAEVLRSAVDKGVASAFGHLAEALRRLDRLDEAVEAGLQGLEHTSNFQPLMILSRVLLDRGEAERLWTICTALRARQAWGGYLPAVMALAAAKLGRDEDVAALIDRDRWLAETTLSFADDFNRRLAAELLAHKAASPHHSTKATRGAGNWIEHLHLAGGSLAQELLARIRSAVETYVAERHVFADHPIIGQRPEALQLNAWAVNVVQDGHQQRHIHPSGWISGVYYVTVPDGSSHDGAGALEFGPLSFAAGTADIRFPRWRITPRPGMLLLFPSYYAHGTHPTGGGEPRICVAFDVERFLSAPEGA